MASDLDWLTPEPVFVGGATIGLFLDAFGRSQQEYRNRFVILSFVENTWDQVGSGDSFGKPSFPRPT